MSLQAFSELCVHTDRRWAREPTCTSHRSNYPTTTAASCRGVNYGSYLWVSYVCQSSVIKNVRLESMLKKTFYLLLRGGSPKGVATAWVVKRGWTALCPGNSNNRNLWWIYFYLTPPLLTGWLCGPQSSAHTYRPESHQLSQGTQVSRNAHFH